MPRNEMFAQFKNDRLGQYVSPRRMAHSASDFFRSTKPALNYAHAKADALSNNVPHPHRQGMAAAMKGFGSDQMMGAGGHIANVTGLGLGTGGMVVGAMTIAGAAGATTLSALTVAGPQVAVTAGVLGLVLAAKALYSNREAAHAELTGYCWSLIDDEAPKPLTAAGLKTASEAALTLIQDGQDQMILTAEKLRSAAHKLDIFNDSLEASIAELGRMDPNKVAVQQRILKEKVNAGLAPDGAIREFARRVVHTGNYIQAPHIYNMSMRENLMPGMFANESNIDYFANTNIGREMRKIFVDLESFYTSILNM
ncbi:hypothetical protein [Sphingobium ummariense]|nr:hypothetical protein [Sphingobium ummariense]